MFSTKKTRTAQKTEHSIWCKNAFGAKMHLVQKCIWCKNAFGAKMHLVQKCIWCKNAFGAKMHFCNATQRVYFVEQNVQQSKMSHFINALLTFCVENVSVENLFFVLFPFFKEKNIQKQTKKIKTSEKRCFHTRKPRRTSPTLWCLLFLVGKRFSFVCPLSVQKSKPNSEFEKNKKKES